MRTLRWCVTFLAVACIGLSGVLVPLAHAVDRVDRKEVLQHARQSYYNLKEMGMIEIRCQVVFDWDSIFNNLKADAIGRDQVLPIMKAIHFEVLVGPNGASLASRYFDSVPPNEEVADRVRTTTRGMEEVLTGFFKTWSQFMINSPIPDPESEYLLEDLGEKYRLAYKEGSAAIVTSMTHDFMIDELKVTTAELDGSVHPHFIRNKNRLLLRSYDASFTAGSGKPQQGSVKLEYQDVEGLNLPGTVNVSVPSAASTIEIPLSFKDCQVKVH
jgi:hypothetical protein